MYVLFWLVFVDLPLLGLFSLEINLRGSRKRTIIKVKKEVEL